MNNQSFKTTVNAIKAMKSTEFASLGVPVVAYVKRVDLTDGMSAYALHGADGAPLGMEASEALAALAARDKNLLPVMVQ